MTFVPTRSPVRALTVVEPTANSDARRPAAVVTAIVVQELTNPLGFAAAIAAREVPIWVGGIVSRRGRTARARNVEARASYERELAEHRATVSGTTAV